MRLLVGTARRAVRNQNHRRIANHHHNATTPVLPEVLAAMMPYLTSEWGNPSSSYKLGSKLKTVVETAREQVAELIQKKAGLQFEHPQAAYQPAIDWGRPRIGAQPLGSFI
ncbi:MAG: aminotransferase class V-fold PLP-dependent enzyme [Verrucomicrobiia bacterium]